LQNIRHSYPRLTRGSSSVLMANILPPPGTSTVEGDDLAAHAGQPARFELLPELRHDVDLAQFL
jgi:hypothetical protein